MAKRKDRNRRALAEWKNPADRIIEKTKKMYGSKINFVANRITENKLSDVLIEFAQPLLDQCDTFIQSKLTITLAVLVWNSYLIPDKNDDQIIADVYSAMGGDNQPDDRDIKDLIAELLIRRRKRYGHDRRLVLNYELSEQRHENHLEVAHMTIPVPQDASG